MEGVRVALHPLTFVEEGEDVVIGRSDIDSFAVFPADAAAVVGWLRDGATIAEAARRYTAAYGEEADIEDLVDTLDELRFVRRDEESGPSPDTPRNVPLQRLGTAVFSAPALVLYAVLIAAAVAVAVRHPALRPGPSKVFFTPSLLLVELVSFLGQFPGIALHESFHVLAGRRLGLPSRLSLGRRLYFVVFQTTLVGLMGVPRRKRVLPVLAGLLADALVASVLTLVAEADLLAHGEATVWGGLALALAFGALMRMAWQCLFFLETDLHHLFAHTLALPDLQELARAYLRERTAWLPRRRRTAAIAVSARATDRELAVLRWYVPLLVVGSVLLCVLAATAALPVLVGFATRFHSALSSGSLDHGFWDAAVAALIMFTQFGVAAWIAVRDRLRRAALSPGKSGHRAG
ncbi:hypothetical protein [Streptomyces sp. TLI_146]|uniref:hypothetical protein n=1 Tax=Streptomyces sp. TLI_146 TaxID=1938858 RepID=UPI000C7020EE|nr:hypothetical protein [Streptomyces sp. TLI_146]PKV89398.1 hypothetical protein BX283_7034 [Streptomyces sp. TLI_146]